MADDALREHLTANRTNAIATSHVLVAVDLALDAFEDELYRQGETGEGWAVMLASQPMIVLPTRRMAAHELRMLKRAANGEGRWHLKRTQLARLT